TTPHDADHGVARGEAAAGRRLEYRAAGFMARHQTGAARRRPAVVAGDDLAIGAADAERQRLRQHGPRIVGRLWPVLELDRSGLTGGDGDRFHGSTELISGMSENASRAVRFLTMPVLMSAHDSEALRNDVRLPDRAVQCRSE